MVLISSQVGRPTLLPPGTCPGAVLINFPLVFVWICRWWWSGCCSHYSCLRTWWTTICRCRVSDHLGTDPYATFVVMSILAERCHLVFKEAGGKVGVYFLPLRCVFREKNGTFSTPVGDRASTVVLFVSGFLLAYIFVARAGLSALLRGPLCYGVELGCRLKKEEVKLLQPQNLSIFHDLAQCIDHEFLVF